MTGIFTNSQKTDYLDPEGKERHQQGQGQQLVAVYDSTKCACVARDALVAAGIPSGAIHVIEKHDPSPAGVRDTVEKRRSALLKAITSLFSPAEDPGRYHLAADPKHAVLVLTPVAGLDESRARQVLSASDPVELYTMPA